MNYSSFVTASLRADKSSNDISHFFSSLFSSRVAYVLFRLGCSPNLCTTYFLISGILSSVALFCGSPILAYLFWRLHIILDMADGTIARATKCFSKAAIGFDKSNHLIINTLFISLPLFSFYKIEQTLLLLISFQLYYNFDLFFKTNVKGARNLSIYQVLLRNILGLEGLVFLKCLLVLFPFSIVQPYIYLFYSFTFFLFFLLKLNSFLK